MPSPRGPVPGNGSLVAAVRTALGGRAPDVVVGKPEPVLFQSAAGGREAGRVLVVGDRLDTDVEGARRAGMASLLVLTGVTTAAELLAAPPDRRPSHVAADCRALVARAETSRVPEWSHSEAIAGAWHVTVDDEHLVIRSEPSRAETAVAQGDPEPVDALRALASAAWEAPQWSGIRAEDAASEDAPTALGLGRYASWVVPTPAT
jgi:hypothetical protein